MATTEKTTAAKKPAAPKAAAPKATKTAAPKAAPKAAKAPAAKAAPAKKPAAAKQTQTGPQVTLRQTKSSAGRIKSQQDTLIGLGLGRIGKTSNLQATPSVQGMIKKVAHLIEVKQSA